MRATRRCPRSRTFSLNASQLGAKTVTESAVAGWSLTDLEARGGGGDSSTARWRPRKATLDIDAGETVVCTFENTKHASLTVVKETDPASDEQDFDFDLHRRRASLPDLDLDDRRGRRDAALTATRSASTRRQLGAKTVTESAVAGWYADGPRCARAAAATPSTSWARARRRSTSTPARAVVCTFENTKHASLTVVKETDPASIRRTSTSICTGTGIDDGSRPRHRRGRRDAALDSSHVQPQRVAARRQDGDRVRDRRLDADRPDLHGRRRRLLDDAEHAQGDARHRRRRERSSARSTNTKHASLTVVKETDPASDPQDFDFDLHRDGSGGGSRPRHRRGRRDAPSQRHVHPQRGPARRQDGDRVRGRRLDADRTSVARRRRRLLDRTLGTRKATLDIDAGETVVCTFENTKHASLTVVKETDPASDRRTSTSISPGRASRRISTSTPTRATRPCPRSSSFSLNASPARRQDGDRVRGRRLDADRPRSARAAAATPRPTWRPARRPSTSTPARSVVCTFKNTKHASLTVVKETDPASDPQDFDFDLTGTRRRRPDLDLDTDAGDATLPSQQSFSLNASQLGAKTVTESAVAGWTLTDLRARAAAATPSTDLGDAQGDPRHRRRRVGGLYVRRTPSTPR